MIKLYIHIGTEKTGSSYIQSLFYNNRDLLSKNDFYFPASGVQAYQMKHGTISPGNASLLNTYLAEKSWLKAEKWLKKLKISSTKKGLQNVILTNEILIKTLSDDLVFKKFIEVVQNSGFQLEKMLLIIRNPTSQAMSLYKHRSKNGKMQPLSTWLNEQYTLPNDLNGFYTNADRYKISFLQYPYKKDSSYLADICLDKWLKIDNISIKDLTNKTVNASLTLSELKLLSELNTKNVFLASQFYEKMLAITYAEKSDDSHLKQNYINQIDNYLYKKYADIWCACNTKMEFGSIELPKKSSITNLEKEVISFSNTQMEQIANFLISSRGLRFKILKTKYQIKKNLKKSLPNVLTSAIVLLKYKLKI